MQHVPACTVSVIVPTYNRADLLEQSVKSALDQTLVDLEVIVVDDGSTDATADVVKRIEDPRVSYIHQENQGVAAARNTGIMAARGTYISFLDSDDLLTKDALRRGVEVMEWNPGVAFAYGQAYLMDAGGRIFGSRRQEEQASYVREGSYEIEKALINGNQIPTSTMLVRGESLRAAGLFDTSFRHGSEDFELWVRLARSGSVSYIAEPLATYRMHESSISRTHRLKDFEANNRRIFREIFKDPVLGPYFSSMRADAYVRLYLRLADYASGSRDMRAARNYLTHAGKICPGWFLRRHWTTFLTIYLKTWFPPLLLDCGHAARRLLKSFLLRSRGKANVPAPGRPPASYTKVARAHETITGKGAR